MNPAEEWRDLVSAAMESLRAARRRAPVPVAVASSGVQKAQPRPRTARKSPKIEQSTTTNPKESPVKTETETIAVRGVALKDPVEARVDRLRILNEHMVNRYLDLAVALHAEHINALWTQVVAPGGGHYENEEMFWEGAVKVKRRTAFQLISVGAVLAQVAAVAGEPTTPAIQAEATEIMAPVGLFKLDVIVPVLKKSPVLPTIRKWADLAKANSRDALRELVNKALGRKEKDEADPGEKFKTYVIGKMPDLESRELATAFFDAGEEPAGSTNAVAIMIAGMQECLGTWISHEKAPAA